MVWNWTQHAWPHFSYDSVALEPLERRFLLLTGEVIGVVRHVSEGERDRLRHGVRRLMGRLARRIVEWRSHHALGALGPERLDARGPRLVAQEAIDALVHELMGWMPPSGGHVLSPSSAVVALSGEEHMKDVHVLAIELAKRSFRVCGTDRGGACQEFRAGAVIMDLMEAPEGMSAPHGGLGHPGLAHDGVGAQAIGGEEHDPTAPHMLLMGVAIDDHRLQVAAIRRRNRNGNPGAHTPRLARATAKGNPPRTLPSGSDH